MTMFGQVSVNPVHPAGTDGGKATTSRLSRQREAVWACVRYGNWWTLAALEDSTGYPQASISARLRDFRKERFGSHTVEREYRGDGVYAYRVVVNDGRG